MTNGPTRLESFGCWLSEKGADISAHPFAQLGLVLLCVLWFALAWRVDWLTAALSILAITLTQMVLNRQNKREKDAHRRDVALHAKLDELLIASRRARDELAGIEELEEEEIEALKLQPPVNGAASAKRSRAASGAGEARPARRAA